MDEQPIPPKRKRWPWIIGGLCALYGIGLAVGETPVPSHSKPDGINAEPPRIRSIGKDVYAMTVEPAADPDEFPKFARDACGSAQICSVFIWKDPELAGRAMPLTERESDAAIFQYGLNRLTGHEKVLWKCSEIRRKLGFECLAEN